jgi:hypothetical protein
VPTSCREPKSEDSVKASLFRIKWCIGCVLHCVPAFFLFAVPSMATTTFDVASPVDHWAWDHSPLTAYLPAKTTGILLSCSRLYGRMVIEYK